MAILRTSETSQGTPNSVHLAHGAFGCTFINPAFPQPFSKPPSSQGAVGTQGSSQELMYLSFPVGLCGSSVTFLLEWVSVLGEHGFGLAVFLIHPHTSRTSHHLSVTAGILNL